MRLLHPINDHHDETVDEYSAPFSAIRSHRSQSIRISKLSFQCMMGNYFILTSIDNRVDTSSCRLCASLRLRPTAVHPFRPSTASS